MSTLFFLGVLYTPLSYNLPDYLDIPVPALCPCIILFLSPESVFNFFLLIQFIDLKVLDAMVKH